MSKRKIETPKRRVQNFAASPEEQFTRIAEEAIVAAERVPCSLEEFMDGLKDIEIAIHERRQLSEHEIDHRDDNG